VDKNEGDAGVRLPPESSAEGLTSMCIPKLEHHCGSWVIVDRTTGQAVLETFNEAVARAVNQTRYEVLTALQWLGRINNALKGRTARG
jgi:hypothetical protein